MSEQKKAARLRMNEPDPDPFDPDDDPVFQPDETPPWEADPETGPLGPTGPIGDRGIAGPSGVLPIAPGGRGVSDELAKILQRMQDTIDSQQNEITKLKVKNPHIAGKLSHAEVVRLAQEKLDKQFAAGNVGRYEWRVQIHGMRQPIVMHIDSKDRDSAIGKLYVKHGVQFNAKRMDMRLVG